MDSPNVNFFEEVLILLENLLFIGRSRRIRKNMSIIRKCIIYKCLYDYE